MDSTTDRTALRARYERLVAGDAPPPDRIDALVNRWLEHCRNTYPARPGLGSNTATNARDATRPLVMLYGDIRPDAMTPQMAEVVRCAMADSNLARRTIRDRMGRIRTMYRWAASRGWVEPKAVEAFNLPALRPGRSIAGIEVKESGPVKPVDWDRVQVVLKDVSAPVRPMIRLQWWTAMRPGEVCAMRTVDINTTGTVWTYKPPHHKNAWRERDRTVYLGPQGIAAIRPLLSPDVELQLFPYTTMSYARAIRRSCERLGIEPWSPNQLRHAALTRLRKVAGAELAQIIAGHAKLNTTEIYAERDKASAERVMREHG